MYNEYSIKNHTGSISVFYQTEGNTKMIFNTLIAPRHKCKDMKDIKKDYKHDISLEQQCRKDSNVTFDDMQFI